MADMGKNETSIANIIKQSSLAPVAVFFPQGKLWWYYSFLEIRNKSFVDKYNGELKEELFWICKEYIKATCAQILYTF